MKLVRVSGEPIAFAPAIALLAALTGAASAQVADRGSAPDEVWSAVCSAKIEHPSYPDAAVRSGLSGKLSALVVVVSGKAFILKLGDPTPLTEPVKTALLATSFPSACNGRRLEVTFTFRIAPDLPENYTVSVCFSHPPNEFLIYANSVREACSNYAYMSPLTGPGGLKPITVCELLADRAAYNGKEVALLGKFLDSHFDGSWLSEDTCHANVTTDGYVWPNEVWLGFSSSAPNPPEGLLMLDSDALAAKLALVRHTTSLRMVEEPRIHSDGTVTDELVQEDWAVVFGRIETRRDLRPHIRMPGDRNDDWGNGFGQMNAAPVQIIYSPENEFFIPDIPIKK